jgi:hypothetical protein
MKLRTKLLLGYAGFVLALGILGAWSARTLSQMSAVSGRIIAENYDSVVAAQDMKESLERQDSAAVFELLGEHERASRQAARPCSGRQTNQDSLQALRGCSRQDGIGSAQRRAASTASSITRNTPCKH